MRYAIRGGTVSSPFVVIPVDPLSHPQYQCGEIDPRFCYPDGTVSENGIYMVGSGTGTSGGAILLNPEDILEDWWLLQQQTPPATNHAPQGLGESYQVTAGQSLQVSTSNGVLNNDSDPEGDLISAVLVSGATHGALAQSQRQLSLHRPHWI